MAVAVVVVLVLLVLLLLRRRLLGPRRFAETMFRKGSSL